MNFYYCMILVFSEISKIKTTKKLTQFKKMSLLTCKMQKLVFLVFLFLGITNQAIAVSESNIENSGIEASTMHDDTIPMIGDTIDMYTSGLDTTQSSPS